MINKHRLFNMPYMNILTFSKLIIEMLCFAYYIITFITFITFKKKEIVTHPGYVHISKYNNNWSSNKPERVETEEWIVKSSLNR